MPKRDSAPAGAPCWIDLLTRDPDEARAFYGDLFGWTSEEAGPEYGGYINFYKEGIPVAGCAKNDGQAGAPDGWTIYLATDDVKATADAAADNSGQVLMPPMDVMDLGSMTIIADPGGAVVGAWQPGLHKGFGVYGEPGTPSWFELHAREYDLTVAFYRVVFGWETHVTSDTPEFRYTTLGEGEDQLAGIMDASAFLPEGTPAHWSVYFGVEDTDVALASIAFLGGRVVTGAEDTPYGRIATAADPTGAQFKLVAS
jgi:predicted enzyme related to lactoylglutathione lyase